MTDVKPSEKAIEAACNAPDDDDFQSAMTKAVTAAYAADDVVPRAILEEVERERDSARSEVAWLGKLLMRTRDAFSYIVSGIEDEGDRVYFGSSNHADALCDIRDKAEAWEEERIMRAATWPDYIEAANKNAARAEAAERALAEARAENERLSVVTDEMLEAGRDEMYSLGAERLLGTREAAKRIYLAMFQIARAALSRPPC